MMKLCIFVGTTIGSMIGWYACEGLGDVAAYIASGVGSLVGVYAGWKFARRFQG